MNKRFLSVVLSVGMAASCLLASACQNGDNPQNDGDVAGKTTIRVATYNGGLGMQWLNEAARRFETEYAGRSFEENKTGVAVKVSEADTGDMLANRNLDKEVYLTESVDYYYLQQKGKLANISDIVTADLGDFGETEKTIEGKLDGAMKDFLTAKDGNYYALPFYDGIYGFVYDVDTFESYGWFLDENGNFTSTSKSKGIDGVEGTYDDGLPKTYAQFKKLLDKIRLDTVTPLVYANESMTYFVPAMANYWADYEGKEKMLMNWYHTGTTDVVASFDASGNPVISTSTLTKDNLSDLQKQPGKYYALKFLKEVLMSNPKNYVSASDFKTAQYQFIQSGLDSGENPVAMIIDGAWFENETDLSGMFELASLSDGNYDGSVEYKKTRKFSFMPIPMADESQATLDAGSKTESGAHKQTIISFNESFCFISASASGARLEVAKEFVKFLHTDAELGAFTAKTSVTRPLTYSLSDTQKNELSYFAKTLVEMKESSDVVYPYSNSAEYVAHSAKYRIGTWGWVSKIGGTEAKNPFNHFIMDKNKNDTAKNYFEGLYLAH